MEFIEMTCQESGIQDPGVKQERDSADNEDSQMINQQIKGNSDDEGNIPKDEIKYEVTSDDDNNNTQMLDNIESHNSQVLSNSECINVYDDIFEIENDTQTDDVKFNILDILDNVGNETAPGASNVGWNESSSEIPLRRLRSRMRVKLIEDAEGGPALKQRRPITSEHRCGNTDPAAALHNKGDTFACHQCNYNTLNKYYLKTHVKIHTGEKPFSCDKCDYKCIKKGDLKRHLLKHTGEKLFSCEKCDYRSSRNETLKRHLLTHTGGKPFSCDKCDYRSSRNETLKRHLLTHTGEKPFSCDKCDYKCNHKISLKQHFLRHTGEKPFSCDKCDYKYIKKGDLQKHLLKHTGEKPFSCYTAKCDLDKHMKKIHAGSKHQASNKTC